MFIITPSSLIEQVRERQKALQQEAEKQRLLQQAPRQRHRFAILRQAVLTTGDVLIAGGTWLKQRAQLESSCADLQTVSGRFSR